GASGARRAGGGGGRAPADPPRHERVGQQMHTQERILPEIPALGLREQKSRINRRKHCQSSAWPEEHVPEPVSAGKRGAEPKQQNDPESRETKGAAYQPGTP